MNKGGFSWRRLSGISRTKSSISRAIGVPLTRSGRQRKMGAAIGALAGAGKHGKASASTDCLVLIIMINLFIAGTMFLAGCGLVGVRKNITPAELTDGRQWHKAGFTSEDAKLWQESGFTAEEAKEWNKIGNVRVYNSIQSQIEDARAWKDSGFTVEEAAERSKKNISIEDAKKEKEITKSNIKTLEMIGFTFEEAVWFSEVRKLSLEDAKVLKKMFLGTQAAVEEIHGWMKMGLKFEEAMEWSKNNIFPQEAAQWLDFGYSPADARREEDEQTRVNKAGYGPNADVYSRRELRASSPYSVKGKYYYLDWAKGIQLLDQFSGIYGIGSYNDHPCFVLLKFKGQDAPPPGSKIKVKAKGYGAFKYAGAIGTLQTIPALEVIAVKDRRINNPYWPNGD